MIYHVMSDGFEYQFVVNYIALTVECAALQNDLEKTQTPEKKKNKNKTGYRDLTWKTPGEVIFLFRSCFGFPQTNCK